MRYLRRLALLVGLLTPVRLTAAGEPVVLPVGLADPAGKTGFLPGAKGGIEAVDLKTGKLLWETNESQLPLLVVGHHLLAQAGLKRNRLRILRLDLTRNGECDLESDPIVFPAWVVTGEAHARSFSARWRLEKNRLVLDWEARAWYGGRGQPKPQEEEAARKRAGGVAVVDLTTGQVDVRPTAELAPPRAETPLPDFLEKKAVRWHGVVGDTFKALLLEEVNGRGRLVLHAWDPITEEAEEPRVLMQGDHLLVRTTLDGRFLYIREKSPRPDEATLTARPRAEYWTLFAPETGQPVGRIPDEPGMHALVVLGPRAYYLVGGMSRGALDRPHVQPRTLQAIDLATGKKLWQRPVAGKLISPLTP
jgi:hypothetical protein